MLEASKMGFLSKLPCLAKFLFIFELYVGALVIGLFQLIYNIAGLLWLIISLGVASVAGITSLILYLVCIALALLLLYGTFKVGVSPRANRHHQSTID